MGKFLQNDGTTKQKEIRQLTKDNYSDMAFSFSTKGTDFVFIDAVSAYRDYLVAPAQGVIIRDMDLDETLEVLRKIRMSQRPEIYLLPIFLQSGTIFHQLAKHVDGIYDPGKIQQIREKSEEINQIAATFTSQLPQSDEKARIWVKTAQFLRSRKMKTLAPIPTRTSNIGYTYPFVGTLFHANEQIKLLQYLTDSLDFGLFEGKIVDKINLCKSCQGSYLNFRDVCPKCGSIDLRSEPIIHHFRCAHVAPESDFVRDYDLVCPKCDKTLRHIGIDYDKPSEVVCCNTCNHTTQDPIMEASCVDCGSTTSIDQIVSKDIYHFDLTIKGEGITQQEFLEVDARQEVLPKGVLAIKDFELMAAQEFRRMSVKGHPSYLLQVKIPPEQFDFLPPKDFRQLCLECTQILKKYFKPLDLFSIGTDNTIWVLLSETNEETSEYMLNLAGNNLQKLLIDNFELEEVQVLADYCLLEDQLPKLL
ncbi:MAG: hypothetical protein AAGJ18_19685 [Bacteroidota bacterium]